MDGALIAIIGIAALLLLFLLWTLCRKIVRLGYFLIAFLVGALLAAAVSYLVRGAVEIGPVAVAAFVFASLWTSIRSKVARFVTTAALLAFVGVATNVDWKAILNLNSKAASAQETALGTDQTGQK